MNTNSSGLCQSIPRRIIGAFEARACLQSARHAARQSKFILRRELRVMDRAETVPPPHSAERSFKLQALVSSPQRFAVQRHKPKKQQPPEVGGCCT